MIVNFFRNKLARIRYKLTPSLLLLKRQGSLPNKDYYLYKTITATGNRLTYWQDIAGGTILWIMLACIVFAVASTPWIRSVDFAETLIIVAVFVGLLVGMPLFCNMGDPVEIINSLAKNLALTPQQICGYSEDGLKRLAREVLYAIAETHSQRQREYLPDAPEFQETYQTYSNLHCQFQIYGLIPKNIGWGPYFKRTATLTF